MTTVEIRTKKPAQYFRAEIKKGYFPCEGVYLWFASCTSCAGGGRKVSILSVIDYKEKFKKKLIEKLKRFARSQKYVIKFENIK